MRPVDTVVALAIVMRSVMLISVLCVGIGCVIGEEQQWASMAKDREDSRRSPLQLRSQLRLKLVHLIGTLLRESIRVVSTYGWQGSC
jgi:hypothetical protein